MLNDMNWHESFLHVKPFKTVDMCKCLGGVRPITCIIKENLQRNTRKHRE